MAKKVNKDKKLKALKEQRDAALTLAGFGGIYGAIKGHELGKNIAYGKQRKFMMDRTEEVFDKARRGEELTENEAKFISNPDPVIEYGLNQVIPNSKRTKRHKKWGAAIGGAAMSAPWLVSAAIDQRKINKLKKKKEKEEKEENEKKFSIMSKEFSSKKGKEFEEGDDLSKLSRNQILKLIDKRAEKVDKDKEDYINKKIRKGGRVGSLLAGLGTAAAVGLGSKYTGASTKESLIRAALSGSAAAGFGYMKGREIAKEDAEDYVKNADEFNKEKVTKKYAKNLDKKMRDLGREDDLEVINNEHYKNEKRAKREYDDYLKHNSVLNLGRNSIRVR